MVKRLREAGAILLGATIMTEGGVTPLGWSAHFQGPYNVYNFDRYCGGSSSGSAVAVAAGLVPVAIGFDGGGSIRIPGSMSGVHGLGVTFGRVPFDIGLDTTMIKPGPLAATAEDAAIVYSIISPNEKGHFYNELFDGDQQGPPHATLSDFMKIEDLSDVRYVSVHVSVHLSLCVHLYVLTLHPLPLSPTPPTHLSRLTESASIKSGLMTLILPCALPAMPPWII